MDDIELQNRLKEYYDNWKKKKQIVTLFLLTHKRPYYVSLMIESIIKQTYSNFYLIVLDNMSCDNTREVVESFNDDRIIYLERESNKNVKIGNYKFAFKTCKTKYLTVFHDDDFLDVNYLNKMLSVMDKHEEIACLSCSALFIDPNNKNISKSTFTGQLVLYKNDEYLIKHYLRYESKESMIYPSVLYRVNDCLDIIFNCDFKNAGPAGDQLVYFELGRNNKVIAQVDLPLYYYRIHSNQDSTENYYTMDFKLLSFLFNSDYYHVILNDNIEHLYYRLRYMLNVVVVAFKDKRINKRHLKTIYNSIPKQLRKRKKGKLYFWYFHFLSLCPRIAVFIYLKHYRLR